MQTSIIIPTCNRVSELEQALKSLLEQTIIPNKIIIVDDSDNDETKNLILTIEKEVRSKNIELKHICKKEKGISRSRNIGIENSSGEINFFFDDDVVLDKDYIKEILKIYEEKPGALGVQGYITNRRKSLLKNIVNRFFFLVHSEKNRNRLLPSLQNVYADPLDKIINCQWMVSNNFSFKKEILETFRFDESIRIPDGEDTDLTYRIFKSHPYSLYQTPFAKIVHKGSECAHRLKKETLPLQVYHTYFFYKDIEQTLKNKLILLWSKIGLLLISLCSTVLRLPESKALRPFYLIEAYIFCMQNRDKIKRGKLDFFKRML